MSQDTISNHAAFVWSVTELLRGDYKQAEYQKVVLPLVMLRRLDAVLEPTKDAVLARYAELKSRVDNLEPVLQATAGEQFCSTSALTMAKLLDDPHEGQTPRTYACSSRLLRSARKAAAGAPSTNA